MNYQWPACDLTGMMQPGYEDRKIEEDLKVRPMPPDDVLCYPLVDSWRERIWGLLSDYVKNDVKDEFVRNPPEYVVSDDLSWLDDIIFDVTGEMCNIKDLAADRLSSEYRAFRGAHGTRTDDLAQFYESGLRFLRAEEVENRARSIFLNGRSKYATEIRLQQAIDEIEARKRSGARDGHLYFCANERDLITRSGGAGHYLIYGSEYLYCLGMRVTSTSDAQKILKGIGRPTMFVCDIPMELVSLYTLQEFAGSMIEYLFCELVDGLEAHALSPGSGSGFSLTTDLSASHIVGHYHPMSIFDPFASM